MTNCVSAMRTAEAIIKSDRAKIAKLAYQKWLDDGAPQSDGKVYWYAAEQELTRSDVVLEEVLDVIEVVED